MDQRSETPSNTVPELADTFSNRQQAAQESHTSVPQTPEVKLKVVEDAVRTSIEGERLGSERSKEFCDYVDFLAAEQDTSEAGKMRKALILETRRQRGNESPEYRRAMLERFGPRHDLEQEILDQAITRERRQGNDSGDWVVKGREQIAESFSKIKEEYLDGKLNQAVSGPAITESVPANLLSQTGPVEGLPASFTPLAQTQGA